tara:strand:- start:1972 stop:2907 length:936 start_codon:yes stop_codon:yes gene_type:complete
MIVFKKSIIFICIFFSLVNFCYSKIQLKIIMKIDNEIITSHDIEKEINYLIALNPRLNQINKEELLLIAKNSTIQEFIKRKEIQKYKELNLKNPQIDDVLNNLIQTLNFQNENQLKDYIKNFNLSVEDLKKKIEIENEWKNLVYSRYIKTIKIDKERLIKKIEINSKEKFLEEYNLSEVVFTKKNSMTLNELFKAIQESIKINGFENTANLYSISNSSKVGGKIGWVRNDSLSDQITAKLKDLKKGDYTSPVQINNNFFIFKINEIRKVQVQMDKEKELDKMILIETSKQLDKFSNIFYNRIKLNSKISEF